MQVASTQNQDGQRLGAIFERVLENWAYLWCEPPEDVIDRENLTLHGLIEYEGEQGATLAVKSAPDFPRALFEAVSGAPDEQADHQDAFRELVNLVGGHVITDFWSSKPGFQSFLPTVGQNLSFPSDQPTASFLTTVQGHPVELILWTKKEIES